MVENTRNLIDNGSMVLEDDDAALNANTTVHCREVQCHDRKLHPQIRKVASFQFTSSEGSSGRFVHPWTGL